MAHIKLSPEQHAAFNLAAERLAHARTRAELASAQHALALADVERLTAEAAAYIRGAGGDPAAHAVIDNGPSAGTVIDRATGQPVEVISARPDAAN